MNGQEEHSTVSDELAREWAEVEPRVERLGRLLDEMESIIGAENKV